MHTSTVANSFNYFINRSTVYTGWRR